VVADYEFDNEFPKFKIADPISQISVKLYSGGFVVADYEFDILLSV